MEQVMAVPAQTILEFIHNNFDRGDRTSRVKEAAKILLNAKRGATFHEWCKRNAVIKTQCETLYQLAEEWGLADKEKFVGALAPTFHEREKFLLAGDANRGDANRAEIEVTRGGGEYSCRPQVHAHQ